MEYTIYTRTRTTAHEVTVCLEGEPEAVDEIFKLLLDKYDEDLVWTR
jgi:hypothetical protein